MTFLEIDNLSAFYGKAKALHDVSLSVKQGEIIAIVGANGAGKSTLLDSIMGLTKTEGDIRLEGKSLIQKTTPEIVQSGVGYAPERFNLFPYMSVYNNLMVGAFTAREDIKRNLEIVEKLFPRLKERTNQETHTQSGGERQMVSLGRALMSSPRLLLVDEPTIGLSPKICLEIAVVLKRLREEFNTTIVITEQNANFAMTLAERLYVLESGSIKIEGLAEELKDDPQLTEAYFGH
mgnify:FL=1